MKQIIVDVSNLTIKEKLRVNEALEKITGATKIPAGNLHPRVEWLFAPDTSGIMMVTWAPKSQIEKPTHTPQQVLEMAGMTKQGHPHAHLMAQYAEDAKITDEPWELWQIKNCFDKWSTCETNPVWLPFAEYRRKPKTHIINGFEVPAPEIREPNVDSWFYVPSLSRPDFVFDLVWQGGENNYLKLERGLVFLTKEDAIANAKAMLGIC